MRASSAAITRASFVCSASAQERGHRDHRRPRRRRGPGRCRSDADAGERARSLAEGEGVHLRGARRARSRDRRSIGTSSSEWRFSRQRLLDEELAVSQQATEQSSVEVSTASRFSAIIAHH
jgi:hypothetical protein